MAEVNNNQILEDKIDKLTEDLKEALEVSQNSDINYYRYKISDHYRYFVILFSGNRSVRFFNRS